jgi:negative regulator of flagellin synthesis FlgM
MNSIDTRSAFFPKGKSAQTEAAKGGSAIDEAKRNSNERASEISERTSTDAKVSIPEGVKDFSRIKKLANSAPEVDNSDRIAQLRAQIEAGTYEIDYDALADKILTSEF